VLWNIAALFLRSVSFQNGRIRTILTRQQKAQDVPLDKASLFGRLALGQIGKLAIATKQAEVCSNMWYRIID